MKEGRKEGRKEGKIRMEEIGFRKERVRKRRERKKGRKEGMEEGRDWRRKNTCCSDGKKR